MLTSSRPEGSRLCGRSWKQLLKTTKPSTQLQPNPKGIHKFGQFAIGARGLCQGAAVSNRPGECPRVEAARPRAGLSSASQKAKLHGAPSARSNPNGIPQHKPRVARHELPWVNRPSQRILPYRGCCHHLNLIDLTSKVAEQIATKPESSYTETFHVYLDYWRQIAARLI